MCSASVRGASAVSSGALRVVGAARGQRVELTLQRGRDQALVEADAKVWKIGGRHVAARILEGAERVLLQSLAIARRHVHQEGHQGE